MRTLCRSRFHRLLETGTRQLVDFVPVCIRLLPNLDRAGNVVGGALGRTGHLGSRQSMRRPDNRADLRYGSRDGLAYCAAGGFGVVEED